MMKNWIAALMLASVSMWAAGATGLDEALKLPVIEDHDASLGDGVFWGIFRENLITDTAEEAPADLRFKPAAIFTFSRFVGAFPESQVLFLQQQGYVAQMTWEPWGAHGEAVPLQDVVDGKWDAFIDDYAKAAARTDIPFMLRWGHEFNGDWYPWAITKNGKDPALYAKAFRHVVERFRSAGASKVQFVWCYNNESAPQAAWNDPAAAYPGDDYVDWIGIDGYNFGTSQSWSKWQSFAQVFQSAYDKAVKLAPSKPILIAETASSEAGGSKVAWIKGMFEALPKMPNIRAVSWFDLRKETSWNIGSSESAWQAMIEGLRGAPARGNAEALLAIGARKTAP